MSHLVTVGGASYCAGGNVVTAVGGMKITTASLCRIASRKTRLDGSSSSGSAIASILPA